MIKKGDVLVILNAEAYVYSMSSNYNGRLRPAEVIVYKNEYAISRFREGFNVLIRGR